MANLYDFSLNPPRDQVELEPVLEYEGGRL